MMGHIGCDGCRDLLERAESAEAERDKLQGALKPALDAINLLRELRVNEELPFGMMDYYALDEWEHVLRDLKAQTEALDEADHE